MRRHYIGDTFRLLPRIRMDFIFAQGCYNPYRMCGLCGIALIHPETDRSSLDRNLVLRMRDRLQHRGPDDAGIHIDLHQGIALAHRRLSIIDLSKKAAQPFQEGPNSPVLVFNGEIYNFQQLRPQLEQRGIHFRTRGDTEVLYHGLSVFGPPFLDQVVGMFALAFWDPRHRRLVLARDRMGQKPLYYSQVGSTLLFGSELRSLTAHPLVSDSIDADGLGTYLSLGYTPGPRTIFRSIQRLEPGHILTLQDGRIQLRAYWKAAARPQYRSLSSWQSEVRQSIETSVQDRLVSDVPLGVFLSGGVDSSILTGLVCQLRRENGAPPPRTFCLRYEIGERSPKYNVDADLAREVALGFGSRHEEATLRGSQDVLELLDQVAHHLDEPHANPSCVNTFVLARALKEAGVTVILTGDGADEIFSGYPRYSNDQWVERLRLIPPALHPLFNTLSYLAPSRREALRRALWKSRLHPVQRYLSWWRVFEPDHTETLTGHSCENYLNDTVIRALSGASTHRPADRIWLPDLSLWVAEESNMRVDKMTMAHSIEARSPFQDHRVVELASRISPYQRTHPGGFKALLKRSFSDLLPDSVLQRPKWGWLPPFYHWVREGLEPGGWIRDTLSETEVRSAGLVEWAGVAPLLSEETPLSLRYHRIWSLTMLHRWHHARPASTETIRSSDPCPPLV